MVSNIALSSLLDPHRCGYTLTYSPFPFSLFILLLLFSALLKHMLIPFMTSYLVEFLPLPSSSSAAICPILWSLCLQCHFSFINCIAWILPIDFVNSRQFLTWSKVLPPFKYLLVEDQWLLIVPCTDLIFSKRIFHSRG